MLHFLFNVNFVENSFNPGHPENLTQKLSIILKSINDMAGKMSGRVSSSVHMSSQVFPSLFKSNGEEQLSTALKKRPPYSCDDDDDDVFIEKTLVRQRPPYSCDNEQEQKLGTEEKAYNRLRPQVYSCDIEAPIISFQLKRIGQNNNLSSNFDDI
jgi:hypothetical protein